MSGERKSSNDLNLPLKEKDKEGEGRSKAWWPKEGKYKVSMFGGQWKEKEKVPMFGGQWNVPSLVANGR